MSTERLDKASVRLVEGPIGSESMWITRPVKQDNGEWHAVLRNVSFFAPLAIGDTVRVARDGDDHWQITGVVQRNQEDVSFQVLLLTEDELQTGVPGDTEVKERAQKVCDIIGEKYGIEGALGMFPALMVVADVTDDEISDKLNEVEERVPTTIFLHTCPDDLEGDLAELFSGVDFALDTEGDLIPTGSDYDAHLDPHLASESDAVLNMINILVKYDNRVAQDLEQARYDRVLLLANRMLDPDPEPLDGPIWSD